MTAHMLSMRMLSMRMLSMAVLSMAVLMSVLVPVLAAVLVRIVSVPMVVTTADTATSMPVPMSMPARLAFRWRAVRMAVAVAVAVAVAAMSVVVVVSDNKHEETVHQQPNHSHNEHGPSVHNFRDDQSADGLVNYHSRHHPYDHNGDEGADNLGASVAIGEVAVSLALRQKERHEAHTETRNVREHVRSVSHDREAVRHRAADDLDDHEDEADAGADEQLALRGSQVSQALARRRRTRQWLAQVAHHWCGMWGRNGWGSDASDGSRRSRPTY